MSSSGTVEGGDRRRIFCALTLPEPVLDALVEWQTREVFGDVRVVQRANLHVTLAFLGLVAADAVDRIAAELRGSTAGAAEIVLRPVGYRETRSVGMVVLDDDAGRAVELATDLFGRLERLGVYRRERRPWLPHVTVIRFRRKPRLRPSLPELGCFSPSGAAVYLSVLRSSGAQYEVLDFTPLGG